MSSAYRILAREVFEPPAPKRQRPDPSRPSARTEAALLGGADLRWTVAWKTAVMSGPAFIPFTCLPDAWAAYRCHREHVRAMSQPLTAQDRRLVLERQLAQLQAELEALP